MPTQPSSNLIVLVDGENIPVKFAEEIFEKLSSRGVVSKVNVYGYHYNILSWLNHRERFGYEVVDILGGASKPSKARNETDWRLSLDAIELAIFNPSASIVIVSNDGDFFHVISKLRQMGRHLILVSNELINKDLVSSPNEMVFLEDLSSRRVRDKVKEIYCQYYDSNEIISIDDFEVVLNKNNISHKDFGFTRMVKFLRDLKVFELIRDVENRANYYISLKELI